MTPRPCPTKALPGSKCTGSYAQDGSYISDVTCPYQWLGNPIAAWHETTTNLDELKYECMLDGDLETLLTACRSAVRQIEIIQAQRAAMEENSNG